MLRRKGAEVEGRAAVAGSLGQRRYEWVEEPDQSRRRRREEKFAEVELERRTVAGRWGGEN